MHRCQDTDILSALTPSTSRPHSRVAAGQEAELGHVQAPCRHTQAIKPVLQAYHQGPPGWGQGCRVPCEELGGGARMIFLSLPWLPKD